MVRPFFPFFSVEKKGKNKKKHPAKNFFLKSERGLGHNEVGGGGHNEVGDITK